MSDALRVPLARDLAKRVRYHRERWELDKEDIAHRVVELADQARQENRQAADWRRQRYAKYRQWPAPGGNFPWPGHSNVTLSDLAKRALNVHDTLHNAVLSTRPPINSRLYPEDDPEKAAALDDLLDYQAFEEQPGDENIGACAEYFTNEGVQTIHVGWIREDREITDIRIYDPIPVDALPAEYFLEKLDQEYTEHDFRKIQEQGENAGWDYEVLPPDQKDKPFEVHFYTRRSDDMIEMLIEREIRVYDGPRWSVLGADDVLTPAGVANLQQPSPTNPGGSPYVILWDRPTIDEIRGLVKSKFYDSVDDEGKKALGMIRPSGLDDAGTAEEQKDVMAGQSAGLRDTSPEYQSHQKVDRYLCYDRKDIDDDGLDEDVVFWVLRDPKMLLRARGLTEVAPTDDGRRPLAESSFIQIPGRREGIGMLELMEMNQDRKKELLDQGLDAGTIAIVPFGFYRPQSNMRPEPIAIFPGTLYPLNNPSTDVYFPTLQNQALPHTLNMVALGDQEAGQLSVIDELQFGRVPRGKASALRTSAGMNQVAQRGEARPERILRRFFIGLRDAFWLMHQFNKRFLSADKEFSVIGYRRGNRNPYRKVPLDTIKQAAKWTFKASIHNASRETLREALSEAMATLLSPIAFTLGISNPEKAYALITDYVRSLGLDETRYTAEPAPGVSLPSILAEEALDSIRQGILPIGRPLEPGGYPEHLETLDEFKDNDEDFGHLSDRAVDVFREYYITTAKRAVEEQKQQQLQAELGQFQQGLQGGGTGGPAPGPQAPSGGNPPVQGGELLDESLPTAGGGADG